MERDKKCITLKIIQWTTISTNSLHQMPPICLNRSFRLATAQRIFCLSYTRINRNFHEISLINTPFECKDFVHGQRYTKCHMHEKHTEWHNKTHQNNDNVITTSDRKLIACFLYIQTHIQFYRFHFDALISVLLQRFLNSYYRNIFTEFTHCSGCNWIERRLQFGWKCFGVFKNEKSQILEMSNLLLTHWPFYEQFDFWFLFPPKVDANEEKNLIWFKQVKSTWNSPVPKFHFSRCF